MFRKYLMLCTVGLVSSLAAAPSIAAESNYAPEEITYLASGETSKVVAERYFDAYIKRDWDRLETLIADDGGFSDPTAMQLFGGTSHRGKAETMSFFRKAYAGITDMSVKISRSIYSSHNALIEGEMDWSVKVGPNKIVTTRAMPIVVVLTIKDGKVTDHKDYADYRGFIEAFKAVRK